MLYFVVILLVLIGVGCIVLMIKGNAHASAGATKGVSAGASGARVVEPASRRIGKPYAAVKVKSRLDACANAIQMRDQILLASEVPSLPLAGCDASTCACRYVHYDDRRDEEDRRSPYQGNHGIMVGAAEDQRANDRRQAE